MKKISIVAPMYNEEEMAPLFLDAVSKVIDSIDGYDFEVVIVNDGSKDGTLAYLKERQKTFKQLVIVDLSRNWGQEPAVQAGLQVASGDAIIPMDSDLQDPPEIIPQLIEMWEKGYQVVNAKRCSRKKDSFFKRNSAGIYYKIISKMNKKVKIPQNVPNYRLMDRKVLDQVLALKESNRVLRVQVPFVGFKTGTVEFVRQERAKGETKYNLKAMTDLAIKSIISLTAEPLKISIKITIGCGILFLLSTIAEIVLFFTLNDRTSQTYMGYGFWAIANIILLIATFIFGILTIISIYLSNVAEEVKHRPTVIINEVIKNKDQK